MLTSLVYNVSKWYCWNLHGKRWYNGSCGFEKSSWFALYSDKNFSFDFWKTEINNPNHCIRLKCLVFCSCKYSVLLTQYTSGLKIYLIFFFTYTQCTLYVFSLWLLLRKSVALTWDSIQKKRTVITKPHSIALWTR